jgi:hypothetical protein
MAEPTFGLVLPFDTDDSEFARGFEAGRAWHALSESAGPIPSMVVHGTNAEMLMRMAEAQGRSVRSRDLDETWIEVEFSEAREGAVDA